LIRTHAQQIQAGATAGDLIEAAQQYGLATTTGTISSVGMWDLPGGGYGSLIGAYGLAADNLLSAQVVTADGQLVIAMLTNTQTYCGNCAGRWQLWRCVSLGIACIHTQFYRGCCCIRWIKREKCYTVSTSSSQQHPMN